MKRHTIVQRSASVVLAAMLLTAGTSWRAMAVEVDDEAGVIVAQAGGTEPRELEPRYQPVPPPEKSSYNSDYVFGMTRGLANSTVHPAAKAPLFLFTVPLDLLFFPFALIGGFFG